MNNNNITSKREIGVISFDTMARFDNPNMGLSEEEIFERMLPVYLNMDSDRPKTRPIDSTSCWPRVTGALKRGAHL